MTTSDARRAKADQTTTCDGDACSIPIVSNSASKKGLSVGLRYLFWVSIAAAWVYLYLAVAKIDPMGPVIFLLGTLGLVFVRSAMRGSRLKRLGGIEAVLSNGKPTVVELYSDACLPCIAVKPLAASVRSELRGKADYVALSVFTGAGRKAARGYGVVGTPTFIHFDATGNEVSRGIKPPAAAVVLEALSPK